MNISTHHTSVVTYNFQLHLVANEVATAFATSFATIYSFQLHLVATEVANEVATAVAKVATAVAKVATAVATSFATSVATKCNYI